jgi:hypothetical protein
MAEETGTRESERRVVTWTSVAVGHTALSMTTRGVFIRMTSFSYSSSHSIPRRNRKGKMLAGGGSAHAETPDTLAGGSVFPPLFEPSRRDLELGVGFGMRGFGWEWARHGSIY